MPNQQYPIGGFAPGNYQNRCANCKELFLGDKRAVQCEPCAIKLSEQSNSELAFCSSPLHDFDNCPFIKQRNNCKSCRWYEDGSLKRSTDQVKMF